MNNIRYIFYVLLAVCSVAFTHAEMSDVKSSKNFEYMLRKKSLVVVVFYKNDKETRRNEALRSNIEALERMVKRVADQDRYKDAHVMFVRVNTARHDLEELAGDYGVSKLPTYMLFNNGRPVNEAVATGFIQDYDLESFIDYYLGNTINAYVQTKAERDRRRRRRSNTYVSYGFGVGGYPYYGYGYPYYGGGVGFGFGF